MLRKYKFWTMIVILSILLYLGVWMVSQFDVIMFSLNDPDRAPLFIDVMLNIFQRRLVQVIALIIAAVLIALSTTVFQTLTQNRIVTPSLLGFDSIFVVTQTTLVYFMSMSRFVVDPILNFMVTVVLMVGLTLLMYQTVLKRHKNNILLLLLIGMVIATLASNYASFLQILMNPTEFQTIMSLTSVSVVNIHTTLTFIVLPVAILVSAYFFSKSRVYDVIALGQTHAMNLGIPYQKQTYTDLIFISIAIAITTALVGPLSFLGLIAVNIAKELYNKYHHQAIFILSSFISIIVLILGQTIVELLGFRTVVTTFISLFGGIYMIYLIIKEHKV
ncbi:MAG: iron chelate uptake ABC transporter family permease subunit [Acholeplasma sp.]